MAASRNRDERVITIVTLRIKPECGSRALELWHEQIADIEDTEPPGNVKYSLYQNSDVDNEFTVVQDFASEAVKDAFMKKAKHEEIAGKVLGEGLIDGKPEARYCTKVAETGMPA